MRLLRPIVAALTGTALLLSGFAQPALAANPVTNFPTFGYSDGENKVTITWFDRSVAVTGSVTDFGNDLSATQVCIWAYMEPNGGGLWYPYSSTPDVSCRGANNNSKTFGFTISDAPEPGGFASVQVAQFIQHADGTKELQGFRTRNRPAS